MALYRATAWCSIHTSLARYESGHGGLQTGYLLTDHEIIRPSFGWALTSPAGDDYTPLSDAQARARGITRMELTSAVVSERAGTHLEARIETDLPLWYPQRDWSAQGFRLPGRRRLRIIPRFERLCLASGATSVLLDAEAEALGVQLCMWTDAELCPEPHARLVEEQLEATDYRRMLGAERGEEMRRLLIRLSMREGRVLSPDFAEMMRYVTQGIAHGTLAPRTR